LLEAGAEVLIVGTSGLFNLHDNLETAWETMMGNITQAQGLLRESA
ncbi:MAG: allulose-6-phosphate 3-epimerase, partial [Mixta calida]|nr:allulose-6-phosphate 3-epimerase [Mixta calida]